jgi:hypothetical protein
MTLTVRFCWLLAFLMTNCSYSLPSL